MEREFEDLYGKLTLQELKTELELVDDAEFMMSMSDNYCYSTGRIYPLHRKQKELRARIKEMESESQGL